jgi:hypothetical protein
MNKVYFFGKLIKNLSGNPIVVLPAYLHDKLNLDSEYAIIIEEIKPLDKKVVTKYGGKTTKICILTNNEQKSGF